MPTITLALVLLAASEAPAGEPLTEKPRVLPQGVVEIHVANLHCKTCAKKLARKLYATPGVKRVRTSVKENRATIELQPRKTVELARLWKATLAAEQEPVALLVLDKQLGAEDFESAEAETAQAVGVRRQQR